MIPTLFIAATTVRWLTLLATAVVLGSLVLARVVVPRERPEWLEARRRLRQWTMLGATVLLVTALAELLLRAQTMSAAGLGQTIAAIPVVLARTHYGAIWIARIAGLAIILSVLVARPSWAEATALGLALAVALSTSLTGHAGDWGDLSLIVFADWAHVVAASAWTGGLLGLALLGFPNGALWPQPGAGAVAQPWRGGKAWRTRSGNAPASTTRRAATSKNDAFGSLTWACLKVSGKGGALGAASAGP